MANLYKLSRAVLERAQGLIYALSKYFSYVSHITLSAKEQAEKKSPLSWSFHSVGENSMCYYTYCYYIKMLKIFMTHTFNYIRW